MEDLHPDMSGSRRNFFEVVEGGEDSDLPKPTLNFRRCLVVSEPGNRFGYLG